METPCKCTDDCKHVIRDGEPMIHLVSTVAEPHPHTTVRAVALAHLAPLMHDDAERMKKKK